MTFLIENTCIVDMNSDVEPKTIYRILHVYYDTKEKQAMCLLIDIWDRLAREFTKPKKFIQQQIDNAAWDYIQDPYAALTSRSDYDLTNFQKSRRTENLALLKTILEADDGRAVFFRKKRRVLILQAFEKGDDNNIDKYYFWIRRWFQRGLTDGALIPDTHNIGNKGEDKRIVSGRKRGRPRTTSRLSETSSSDGINITPRIKKKMIRGLKKYYMERGVTFIAAYELMVQEEFNLGYNAQGVPNSRTENTDSIKDDEDKGFPTDNQAKYWWDKEMDPEEVEQARRGNRFWTSARPIDGDSYMIASKPGHCQLDAVRLPFQRCHPLDRSLIVGSSTANCIIDTESGYIFAMDPTSENESWRTIGYALVTMAEDKVEYCARYGIEIHDEDWLSNILAKKILTDNGPAKSYNGANFAKVTKVEITYTLAYRPDLKGKIEIRFRIFLIFVMSGEIEIPGLKTDFKKLRFDKDYVLDAALTPYEETQIIIHFVLWHNNGGWEMPDDVLTLDMMRAGVRRTPASVIKWRIENTGGLLRTTSLNTAKKDVLTPERGLINRFGIRVRGIYFNNKKVESRSWSIRGRKQKKKNLRVYRYKKLNHNERRVEVFVDERLVDIVWIRLDDGMELEPCFLSNRRESYRYKGCTWDEVHEIRAGLRDQSRLTLPDRRQFTSRTRTAIENIVARAVAERDDAIEGLTNTERKSNRTENRQDVIKLEQQQRQEGRGRISPDESIKINENTKASMIITPTELPDYIPAPKRTKLIQELTNTIRRKNDSENEHEQE